MDVEKKKLDLSNSREGQIRKVVTEMMYVFGDVEAPSELCIQFVTNMVKYQCVKFLEDAHAYSKVTPSNCTSRKRNNDAPPLDLKSSVFLFRRNPLLLSRLYRFAKTAAAIRSLSRDTDDGKWGQNDTFDSDIENGSESDDNSVPKITNGVDDQIGLAIDALQNPELSLGKLEKMIDRVTQMRDLRQYDRVKRMTGPEYENFSEARKATFRMSTPKMSQPKVLHKMHTDDILLSWLGSPPVGLHVDFVVAFIAKETLAYLVEGASVVRDQEAPNLFSRDPCSPIGALQLRHYEEALRLNMGYRRSQDLLFGYF